MGFIERLSGLFDRGGTGTLDGKATSDAGPDRTSAGPQETGSRATTETGATTTGAPGQQATDTDDEPAPDPTAAFAEQAATLSGAHPDLDGSLDSLAAADDLAATSDADTATVLALGSYFGETLLSAHDGEWTKPEGGTWAVVLDGAETDVTLNAFQLAGEVIRGPTTFAATYRAVERRL
ncbi:hypothetical protein [Haloarchaeobius iranensis]|uniref:Uncharacterized protein n=1 Tax=Haloarchaeobius iranensis TaxID=996166 RepID=A0A1H0ADH1_9EURY|nr:hypothetical protein [Haloarchaeobius iranensis]SDN30756.1 hypothetical protein SAMN05192554_1268 [Haloarchaeobius iranensis]